VEEGPGLSGSLAPGAVSDAAPQAARTGSDAKIRYRFTSTSHVGFSHLNRANGVGLEVSSFSESDQNLIAAGEAESLADITLETRGFR
jgi:hypothetical protein